ncbi:MULTISPECIES: DUF2812 domain-containing protein [unclassified Paenibacillus]|uniref:DUF2812 domain-containing protein n=1 Tax=unclassified Paenibacillus TaxID=185978 RepID=UPI0003E2A44B|nr:MULTISPECIES: DUF2812 domain-containing protein [unclassified Paenibacillus]ETT53449.1 hypothetical protein C162_06834 [Paenibacillus sp. FSL R7-269]OMF98953.1 hypothetical protein BK147_09025 [Paenibacillus sp. FSL R7-0337]
MSQVVRKFFMDFEKEEAWLNEMSAKGWALVEHSWARYVFEESAKGEYIYRIELLEKDPKEAAGYLLFMEETGAERVPSGPPTKANRAFMNQRWVFFRRKASEGPFQIYTDADSKIKHYQRIYKVYLSLAFLELIIGSFNIMLIMLNTSSNIYKINLIVGVSVIILGLFFVWLSLPVRRKIARLQQEKLIRE